MEIHLQITLTLRVLTPAPPLPQYERPGYEEWIKKKREEDAKANAVEMDEEQRARECCSSFRITVAVRDC